MFLSIMFVILFLTLLAGIVLYPKTSGKINLIKALVMGTMAIFCYQALMAFIYNKLGIRVGIKSTTVSMAIADLVLWIGIFRKKKLQKVFFRVWDALCLVILAAFVLMISMHLFTPELRLSYLNTDPANHFNYAMRIVKNGVLDSIYFSAFVDAAFIELFAPMIAEISYYKAFIIADIFMHVLEIWMFYVLAITISSKMSVKILAPLFSVCYFFGYPAYSYMTGGFVYWSNGVMILIFIIYALLLLERYPAMVKGAGILLFLGAYANSCCNKLFIPVNYFALFTALFVIIMKRRKHVINKKIFFGALAGVAVVGIAAAFMFWNSWGGSLKNMIEYVTVPGGMYASMYADLIFFLPAMFLVFYFVFFKREYSKTISLMAVCMIICTVVMYIFWYNYLMSTYYYYKIYYNLWLFGWLLAVLALHIMEEKKQLVGFFSYGGLIAAIGALTLTNYDYNMWHHNVSYNGNYATKQLFSLYRYNMDSLLEDYSKYELPAAVLDVYAYAVEHTEGENIPVLTSDQHCMYWFDGMMVQDSREVRGDQKTIMEIARTLDAWGTDKIMVIKTDDFYQKYEDYLESCIPIYENDSAALLTYAGAGFSDTFAMVGGYPEGKLQLYHYAKEELEGEVVPLIADESSYFDFITHYNVTGETSEYFYTWEYNPLEGIENLNEHGVKYIIMLKGDKYYQDNAQYFDSQEIVFETEEGKIIKCNGNKWSTVYK